MVSSLKRGGFLSSALFITILIGFAYADETPKHYAPEPSDTLQQAVTNFVTYTDRVEAVLARASLSAEDMEEVHELTYTLEVSLARINSEMASLPDVLETLHKASEGDDPVQMKDAAEAFLTTAKAFQGD